MKKTLKNVAIIAILGIILFTLTGCANVDYDIKLNKDGSGDIAYVIGYDKSFLASIGVETSSLENDNSFSEMEEQAKQNEAPKAQATAKKGELPQTGTKDQGWLAALGVMIISALGLAGVAKRKQQG